MFDDSVLLESETLRTSMTGRTEVLDRVKTLTLLPDDLHMTTRMVAAYFGVDIKAVRSLVVDHRQELEANGYRVLSGAELSSFKELSSLDKHTGRHLALFTRRTVLNVAMLLRDSVVARQVRTYLLDAESGQRSEPSAPPVENSVFHNLEQWLDARVLHHVEQRLAEWGPPETRDEARLRVLAEEAVRSAVGRAVVPLLNELIRSDSELRRRLSGHQEEIARLNKVLWERDAESAGSLAALDELGPREFAQHIAWLCRRDGCTGVTVPPATSGREGRADVLGHTADGRRLVVQCERRAPNTSVTSADVQAFVGAARREHRADAALLVSTAPFTRDALLRAARHDVTAVHRGLLESWNNGARLRVLESVA
ncbi:restriction endonuclease [Streptomyces sp. NPDC048172]|uniref:restriction endonuclease n=1 Tax=Streptomyces sp. NPDC048172 TaxID=3365505 RepID=UPI003710224F